jgi:hypothetical protein
MSELSIIYTYTDDNGETKQGWALIEEVESEEEGLKFFRSSKGTQGIPADAVVINTLFS